MTLRHLPIDESAVHLLNDIDEDCDRRLLATVRALPDAYSRRYLPAARRAGRALEGLRPLVLAFTAEGHPLIGCYSEVGLGHLLVVIADAKRITISSVPVREIDELVTQAARTLTERPELDCTLSDPALLGSVAQMALDDWGTDSGPHQAHAVTDFVLGVLLRAPEHRCILRQLAAAEVIPALVTLLAEDPAGAITFPFGHARTFPVAAIAEVGGSA